MRASGIVFAHDPRRRAEDGDNLLKVGRNGRTSLGEYGANGKLTVSCRECLRIGKLGNSNEAR